MANRLAIVSLSMAVVGVIVFVPLFLFVPLLSVPAAVLGVIARRQATGRPGVALAGTVLGTVMTAIWVVLMGIFWVRYAH